MGSASFHENFSGHAKVRTSSDRSFGLWMAGVFFLAAVWRMLRGGELRLWALVVAAVFGVLAIIAPGILSLLNRYWTAFGLLLGRIVNPVVLTLLYYVVFTPIAVIMRASGKDTLRLRSRPAADTYWIDQSNVPFDPASMRQQY